MGSIAYGTRHARSGEELTEAVHLARSILVHIQETTLLDTLEPDEAWPGDDSGLDDEPETRRQLDAAPLGGLDFTLSQLERYRRRITSERASEETASHRYQLARVTVYIYWESKQGQRQTEITGMVSHARP